jgi:hypothetical protein
MKNSDTFNRTKTALDSTSHISITSAIKDTGASSKKKATKLTKNKTCKGLVYAGQSAASRYTLKTTKSQVITLNLKGLSYDGINVTMYDKDNNEMLSTTINADNNGTITVDTGVARPAGSYYICVQRKDALSSGWYSLNWN